MKIRLIAMILAVAALFGVLSGCTGKSTEQETIPILQEVTEAPAVLPDLETLYNQGMEVLAQMGDEAPILFPETNIGYLNEFYPGLADIEMKQFYAGVAPVTNAPLKFFWQKWLMKPMCRPCLRSSMPGWIGKATTPPIRKMRKPGSTIARSPAGVAMCSLPF